MISSCTRSSCRVCRRKQHHTRCTHSLIPSDRWLYMVASSQRKELLNYIYICLVLLHLGLISVTVGGTTVLNMLESSDAEFLNL